MPLADPAPYLRRGRLLIWSAALLFVLPGATTLVESMLAWRAPSDLEALRAGASIALAVGLWRRARLARWLAALSTAVMLWAAGPAFVEAVRSGPSPDERIAGVIGLIGNVWVLYVLIISPSAREAFAARTRRVAPVPRAAAPTPGDSAAI